MSAATAVLEINLGAIIHNWQLLRGRVGQAACAAVVKANAYGLGITQIAKKLADSGCETFFVATLDEAIGLRTLLPHHEIGVFHGVQAGEGEAFLAHRLIPVLNSLEQLERWETALQSSAKAAGKHAILHVDTGMNRLGLDRFELALLAQKPERIRAANIHLLMSHLACASTRDHAKNEEQREAFLAARLKLPPMAASLSNSAGIMLGSTYHFEMVRPGCALYGINPNDDAPSLLQPVVRLRAPIVQIRTTRKTETVGYGASVTVDPGRKLATVALGYADGFMRAASNQAYGFIGDIPVKQIGIISMDLTIFDITDVPQSALDAADGMIELMGARHTVDDVARASNTIGYEIFTRLGPRLERQYINA